MVLQAIRDIMTDIEFPEDMTELDSPNAPEGLNSLVRDSNRRAYELGWMAALLALSKRLTFQQ